MGERQTAHPTLKETKQMVPPTAMSSSSSSSSRLPPVPAMTSQLDEEATASRITELNKDKVPQSRPMLFPSGHSYSPSVPPPSSQTRAHSSRSAIPSPGDEAADDHEPPVQVRSKSKRQKTGKSKQRRSYDSGSDSSAEDKKTSKMHEREVKELEDPVQKLMQKRETLLKRARSLTEQKDLMMNQREDIISNHKGDKSSLNNLLQENWFLVKEMGNQITKINHMVIEVEKEIEVLKPGNQPLPRAESPQRRRSRSPPAMRFCGPSRQYEHGKTPERNYKHVEASYRNESKGYEYPEHRRSVSPASGKHRSRSPAAAGPHRISSPAARQQRSRSPNVSRHKSRSPNAGRHRTRSPVSGGQQQRLWSPSGEYSKEFQRAPSTSRKRTTAGKPDGEKRQQDMYRKKEEPKEEIDEGLQYPQGFVQRTYIRYCDQGMHWCKLCSIFCESIPEYVDHLLSSSHLAKCKYDRKTWLAKAPKEEKEPKPPNATALIVPVQGVEFLHSLTSYYCSLCDVFMRDKGEAVRHPESKIHTSNYKMHLVKNPMYEASLVKTKAAAYAKYSVEQARYMVEAKMKLKEKIATDEIEEKLLRQIKQKRDMVRQEKEESTEINEKVEKERSQRQESKKEKSEKREREKKVVESDSGRTLDHKNESSVTQTQASESKEYKDTSTRNESKKEKGSSREVVTKDLKTEGDEAAFADGSYKDGQDDEKKSATPKLPLIGKMPFLKKKQQSSVPKRKESSKETKQDIAASSNLVLDPKMEIPLTEDEQKIDLSDNIAWVMSQENENLIENVADPKTIAENEYPVVSDMDVCPLTSDYTGYEEQSGEVTNQDEEEYSCLDDLNTSECMDIEDDEPTECAAAATLKALDLLSIPLPGFKSANKTPLPSDIPLPPKTDEASKNQDNCDLPLPPGEESYPVTHFEMDNDSQEILAAANMIHDVHRDCGSGSNSQDSFPMVGLVSQGGSDMPVPPGTESVVSSDLQVPLLTAEVGSDLPLPPGTESMMGPSLPLPPGTENIISPDVLPPGTEHVMDPGLPLPPGTEDIGVPCLPLPPGAEDPLSSDLPLPPGTEDVAIASLPLPPGTEDTITSDLPLPPGTEDEAHMLVGSGLGVPSTKSKTVHLQDIAQKSKLGSDMTVPGTHFGAQELSSGAWSSGSNSQDGFGLPAFMTGMHENPIPPPPGTEDEHDLHASMNVLPPMGIRDNIASQFASEKALTASQTTTVCMSSFTAPKLGLHTQNALWNTSSNPEGLEHAGTTWPTDPSTVMDMPTRKSHIDREFTPPPPGTEMDDLNKSDSHPELGEASMELSDESDEECLQDKKESTPPPPGTESSSESMAISESKSGKSIISTLELSTRLDTKIRDPSLSVDFNAQSLDTQVNLPQSKKEESIKSTENIADSLNLSNVNVSKIGKRSCSTEDKEREEKKFSEKAKVNKAEDKVDDERMQTEGNMSKEQGPPQQSQKAPRIGKPSKKESEEVEHGKEGRQESESKGKQRKTSRRSRDSTEEPQYLQPVEEESEFPEVKSSTPKKSTRTGKTEKSEEEVELEAKINEESSTKHRKASKKTKERRESVDDLKLAADTDASASQEETQTMKKSSRSGRSTKKDKDENDQDVPVKETKQRKRSTRSSSDDQPSEKGSSTPRRKSRSVRATIPEEREEDLESVLSPQEMSENADESEKANSSDVEDEQETDSETVPQQRTRAVRRLVSEDQTYEALSPRKRSRKSKPSVSEEEEPPPRRSTRTTRASITE